MSFSYTQFGLDLRLARRRSGLTQRDCAHLLAVRRARIVALEHGRDLPTLPEICGLSLVYGRTFESLYGVLLAEGRDALRRRLETIPRNTRQCAGTLNRSSTLDRLSDRLAAETDGYVAP